MRSSVTEPSGCAASSSCRAGVAHRRAPRVDGVALVGEHRVAHVVVRVHEVTVLVGLGHLDRRWPSPRRSRRRRPTTRARCCTRTRGRDAAPCRPSRRATCRGASRAPGARAGCRCARRSATSSLPVSDSPAAFHPTLIQMPLPIVKTAGIAGDAPLDRDELVAVPRGEIVVVADQHVAVGGRGRRRPPGRCTGRRSPRRRPASAARTRSPRPSTRTTPAGRRPRPPRAPSSSSITHGMRVGGEVAVPARRA